LYGNKLQEEWDTDGDAYWPRCNPWGEDDCCGGSPVLTSYGAEKKTGLTWWGTNCAVVDPGSPGTNRD